MYSLIYLSIKYFPKKDQYALGIRIENMALEILELALLARAKSGLSRMLILKKLDLKLKILKLMIRLASDLKILSTSRYISLQEKALEIGKMLGGWIKKLDTKPAN